MSYEFKEMLSAKEAASYLGVSRTTLWRKTKDGSLPGPVKMAGMPRWRQSELLAFLDAMVVIRDGEV